MDLDRFIADCVAAAGEGDPQGAIHAVLDRVMAAPDVVLRAVGEPLAAGLGVLYRSASLTIVNATWTPHMTLMPHNHGMWALIGLYTGREDNILWRRNDGSIEAHSGRIEAHGGRIEAHSGRIEAHSGRIEAHSGRIEAHSGRIEAHSGRIEAHSGRIEAHSGRIEAHSGRIEAHSARALFAGDTVALPADAIHSVSNPLGRFAGGIHIYGGDFLGHERQQWDAETLAEQPSDGAVITAIFERENARLHR
jgi:predicted metal-dependent enzyme (double-stranded beta helix superfamily)